MNRVAKQQGFTLIELMLAMTFIALLLLAIAMTIIQIGTIYNRGITLKEVNQAARSIGDDLRRGIAASEAFSLTSSYYPTSAGGRLCLGQYSYIWNLATKINSNDTNLVKYQQSGMGDIRFIKIPDPNAIYCAKNGTGGPATKLIPAADTTKVIDPLKAGDRILAIHGFSIESGANAKDSVTGQQLYMVSFVIGTGDTTALNADQTACLPPNTPNSDYSYCTVQQFGLVVRAGNRVN